MNRQTTGKKSLWQDGPYTGTSPIFYSYRQNADFSTFPILIECVYRDLEIIEPCIRRLLPFCAFQHVCTGVLNASVIDYISTHNAKDRFAGIRSPMYLIPADFVIPAPIIEYCKLIADSNTPQGDFVKINFPDAAIPTKHTEAAQGVPEIPAGTFGVLDSANHNAYECYMSPYVTSQLVQATLDQNLAQKYGPWEPLPANMVPAGAVPTLNLLGFQPHVERLKSGGLNALLNINFPNGDDISSQLRWSSELVARCSGTMRRLQDRYKMHVGKITPSTTPAILGWVCATEPAKPLNTRLSTLSITIRSSVKLGPQEANMTALMGLKRERTSANPGYCYLAAGDDAIPGWEATINSNFTMAGPFAPKTDIDLPSLRQNMHQGITPGGDRTYDIQLWLRRNFMIKKMNWM